jgi:hypothetical protein
MKPKSERYSSAKKLSSVVRVCRRFVIGFADPSLLDDDRSRVNISLVTMAVWVTLSGIMTVLTGVSNTIWAASAARQVSHHAKLPFANTLTITHDVELSRG